MFPSSVLPLGNVGRITPRANVCSCRCAPSVNCVCSCFQTNIIHGRELAIVPDTELNTNTTANGVMNNAISMG